MASAVICVGPFSLIQSRYSGILLLWNQRVSDSVQHADVGRLAGGTLVVAAALAPLWPVMLHKVVQHNSTFVGR